MQREREAAVAITAVPDVVASGTDGACRNILNVVLCLPPPLPRASLLVVVDPAVAVLVVTERTATVLAVAERADASHLFRGSNNLTLC